MPTLLTQAKVYLNCLAFLISENAINVCSNEILIGLTVHKQLYSRFVTQIRQLAQFPSL
jgi:hypothetical protein